MGLHGLFQRDIKSLWVRSVWRVKLLGSSYFRVKICKFMRVSDVFFRGIRSWEDDEVVAFAFWF